MALTSQRAKISTKKPSLLTEMLWFFLLLHSGFFRPFFPVFQSISAKAGDSGRVSYSELREHAEYLARKHTGTTAPRAFWGSAAGHTVGAPGGGVGLTLEGSGAGAILARELPALGW